MTEPILGDDEIQPTEHTPLIGSQGTETLASSPALKLGRSISPTPVSVASGRVALPWTQKSGVVLSLYYLIVLTASIADAFKLIPMTRIYEDILCRRYYNKPPGLGEPINEDDCKIDALQSELAYLFATLESLGAGIGCFVALFWGIVADRIGRKPVFVACGIGMFSHSLLIVLFSWFADRIPVRLVWISSIAHIFGGPPLMGACTYSMVSDIVPETNRSIAFMRVHVASLSGNLVAPALASAMMSLTGPWPALLLTIPLWTVAVLLILLIPETLHRRSPSDNPDSTSMTIKKRVLGGIDQLKGSISILKIRSVALILCICLLSLPVVMCTLQLMVQYISKHYHIPIAKTGYVQSLFGIAHIVVVLLIVPNVSKLVVRPTTPKWLRIADEKDRDLVLARWSYVIYAVGSFILGVSPSLPVFIAGLVIMSFGAGSASFIKSVAASHVDVERRSRLFTLMTLLEITSAVWSMPVLAGLFTLGMRLGGLWIGLPYLGVSLICLVMLALALFVRTRSTDTIVEEPLLRRGPSTQHGEGAGSPNGH